MSTSIRDVASSLTTLIEAGVPSAEIVFKSPAEIEPPSGMHRVVSVFLFRVVETPDERNLPRGFESALDPSFPPLVVDLHYLVTAYAPERADEFDLLERVARTLYDHATLRGPDLAGALLESGNEPLRVVPQMLSLEDIDHLWSTFGKPLRPALSYVVTPVRIPSLRTLAGPRVLDREVRHHQILGEQA